MPKYHQIPPEVIDLIIDHCHDEKETLRTCSLVCKGWLSSSRYHLFSTVTLDYRNASSFLTLLESPSGLSISPLVAGLGLLADYDLPLFIELVPALSSYLRPVSLKLSIQNDTEDPGDFDGPLGFPPRSRKSLSVFVNAFQTVTSLNISISCDTFIEIAEIVTSFPLLKQLVFSGEWDTESEVEFPPRKFALPSHLKTLECQSVKSYFFRWLLDHSSIPHPSTLTLGIFGVGRTGIVGRYLQESSETLQNLSIKSSRSQSLLSDSISLQCLSQLRTINIHVWNNAIAVILHLLSQVNSISIEAIEFAAWDPISDPPALWDELDVLLISPRFPKLRQVTVNVNAEYHMDVELRLRYTNSRNILRFRNQNGKVY